MLGAGCLERAFKSSRWNFNGSFYFDAQMSSNMDSSLRVCLHTALSKRDIVFRKVGSTQLACCEL